MNEARIRNIVKECMERCLTEESSYEDNTLPELYATYNNLDGEIEKMERHSQRP